MATQALRTMAIAYKDIAFNDYKRIMNDLEQELDIEEEEEESKN
jgi:hypothetical protein